MSEAWQLGILLDQAHNEWSYEKYMQKRVGNWLNEPMFDTMHTLRRHKLNSRRRFLGYKCKLRSDSAADSHTTEQKLSFVDFKSLFWEICDLNFHGNKPKWLYFASKFVGSFDVVLNCGKGS